MIELSLEVGAWLLWILTLLMITYWVKCIYTSKYLQNQHEQKVWYIIASIVYVCDVIAFFTIMEYISWV